MKQWIQNKCMEEHIQPSRLVSMVVDRRTTNVIKFEYLPQSVNCMLHFRKHLDRLQILLDILASISGFKSYCILVFFPVEKVNMKGFEVFATLK